MTRLLGLVIGVLNLPAYDPETGAKLPDQRGTVPVIRPEDEMKWRYLAFLQQERDWLAEQLGATSRLGIYTLEDRSVNRFFSPHIRDQGRHLRPGNRAEAMLETAGVSVMPDPGLGRTHPVAPACGWRGGWRRDKIVRLSIHRTIGITTSWPDAPSPGSLLAVTKAPLGSSGRGFPFQVPIDALG